VTDSTTVVTEADVERLAPGQWVWDANGTPRCLVDTYVAWPQRMFMSESGAGFTGIPHVTYPLTLAELAESPEVCQHRRTQEMGHCLRCGRVVAEARPQPADPRELAQLRAVLAATSRKDPT